MKIIEAFFIYPIKSCRGIASDRLKLTPSGPIDDRGYVLVDENGTFHSQRTLPKMARIKVSFGTNCLGEMAIWMEAPGMERHCVTLCHGESIHSPAFKERSITIHKDACTGIDLGDDHARWFSAFLGKPCRLIKQVSRHPRMRAPSSLGRQIEVTFADGYPLLVTTTESLADLNQNIRANGRDPVTMDRFRPNIVLSGCEPYAEDAWRKLKIGDVLLEGAKKCDRCPVTLVDQQTGDRGKEPLRTLADYRKNSEGKVDFGRYFVINELGAISVGQEVEAII